MTMLEIISGIYAYPQRAACSDSEAKAAEFVHSVMQQEGMQPRYVDFTTWPKFFLVYALHLALAVTAGVLGIWWPWAAAAGLLFVILSFYGDLTTRWYWLRRLIGKGKSRHVVGTLGPADAKRVIAFSGHLDAGYSSPLMSPEKLKRWLRFNKHKLKGQVPQFLLLWGAMWLILAGLVLHGLAANFTVVLVLVGVGGGVCLYGAYSHLTFWGKGVGGGANDNASGVAAAVETGRRLKDKLPPDTRLMIIAFGAEESMVSGSTRALPQIVQDLDSDHFYLINFDGVGGGTIRYTVKEGTLIPYHYDPELIAAARKVARKEEFKELAPYVLRQGGTDALPFVVRGYKAISLLGLDEDDYPPNYHWPTDTPENIDERSLEQAVRIACEMVKDL